MKPKLYGADQAVIELAAIRAHAPTLREHKLRLPLAHEIHNRPFGALSTSALVSHLAVIVGETGVDTACRHLGAL